MTLAAYTGHEPLTFTDYTDLDTGKTLHAEPGGVYDVAPASGRVIPEFPAPWFTPAISAEPDVYASGGIVMGAASLAGDSDITEPADEPGEAEDHTAA